MKKGDQLQILKTDIKREKHKTVRQRERDETGRGDRVLSILYVEAKQ